MKKDRVKNKRVAFYKYKRKRGMEKYRIYDANNRLLIIKNSYNYKHSVVEFVKGYYDELRTVKALSKRLKIYKEFIVMDNDQSITFNSADDLLQHLLIKKISGLDD